MPMQRRIALAMADTEERAALVRQRAGLFGVMAVLGLVLAIIAPFMGSGLM